MSYMEGEDQNNKEQHFSTILLRFQDTSGNMILKTFDAINDKWKCDWNYNCTKNTLIWVRPCIYENEMNKTVVSPREYNYCPT